MAHGTIFPVLSMDRSIVHWEDSLASLTPIEQHNGLWFKREDYFAPLGYGGINGAKLRQAIWLYAHTQGTTRLITGASVKSPQLPMGTAVARHFGNPSVCVIGATTAESAINRDMVKMATWFGAEFDIQAVAYNPVLQKRVAALRREDDFTLEYGITLDHNVHPIERVAGFHVVGGMQVQNIPRHITTLLLPAGSCNSATSILVGLLLHPAILTQLRHIVLFGIGPSKLKYLTERVTAIAAYLHVPEDNIQRLGLPLAFAGDVPYWPLTTMIEYLDLDGTGYVKYQDEMHCVWDGIELHPTYESKVMNYILEHRPEYIRTDSLFWIIGSKPRIENMECVKALLGDPPTELKLYHGGVGSVPKLRKLL